MAKLDPDDSRPPHQQVADHLRTAIDSGKHAPRVKPPSYNALAEELCVSFGVVKRATTQPRDERVIVIRHGEGSYARVDRASMPESFELDKLRAEAAGMGRRLEAVERLPSEL